jgi:hypothetical protein
MRKFVKEMAGVYHYGRYCIEKRIGGRWVVLDTELDWLIVFTGKNLKSCKEYCIIESAGR